jgi:hypothetical protein
VFTADGDQLWFKEYMTNGWSARDVGSMPLGDVAYDLGALTNQTLASLFSIYEWDSDNGFNNLGKWIETAAEQAGRS